MDDIAKGTKLKYEEFPVDFLCIKVPPTNEMVCKLISFI